MKKKEDINDYITAYDAAAILTQKRGRVVRPDYLSKMVRMKKHHIRTIRKRDRQMYYRPDIEDCTLK